MPLFNAAWASHGQNAIVLAIDLRGNGIGGMSAAGEMDHGCRRPAGQGPLQLILNRVAGAQRESYGLGAGAVHHVLADEARGACHQKWLQGIVHLRGPGSL